MVVRLPDGSVQYTDASGKLVTLTVFNGTAYAAATTRISEQASAVSKNQSAVNNYNAAVAAMQISVDDGLQYEASNLPPVPKMEVWPDDPTLDAQTVSFPAGTLAALHAAPPKTPTPNQGGLGPQNPNRTASPLDPAIAARFDTLEQMLSLIYSKVSK